MTPISDAPNAIVMPSRRPKNSSPATSANSRPAMPGTVTIASERNERKNSSESAATPMPDSVEMSEASPRILFSASIEKRLAPLSSSTRSGPSSERCSSNFARMASTSGFCANESNAEWRVARKSTAYRPSGVVKTPSCIASGGCSDRSRSLIAANPPSGSAGSTRLRSEATGDVSEERTLCACFD
ncbi:MAG: hypothetical protein E6G94_00400, partial [Alphaproteobacteria bacterium]